MNLLSLHFTMKELDWWPCFSASHNILSSAPLICLSSEVSYITNNMDPDQTAPKGTV